MQCLSKIANGDLWLGRQCMKGPVLYVDAEMPYKLFCMRLRAVGLCENFHFWHHKYQGFPSTLSDPRLIEAAKRHKIIVIDPLKRFMNGLDEKSSTAMAAVTADLRNLATRGGCTVVAPHHSGKQAGTSGYRGSTELGAGVDIALSLEVNKTDTSKILRISSSKTRYADEIDLVLKVVHSPQGPVFSDTTKEERFAAEAAADGQLNGLRMLVVILKNELGRLPKQTEIVERARALQLGSRNTVLGYLKKGEGTHWRSSEDSGHAVIYDPIVQLSSCPET